MSSCKEETALPQKTEYNVAYGNDPKQKMDVYLPAGRSSANTKVIILIHGGGWNQGDKADFNTQIDSLLKRLPGYAIFNINYRLNSGSINKFPAQEEDVKAALNFIYGKRSSYGISDDYVLLGASAGAHLALLQAYKNTTAFKVRAVVDFFGPTQLVDLYNNPVNPLVTVLLQNVTGGTPTSHHTVYLQSSPKEFVTSQSPPTIILHGGVDALVPASQSEQLRNALQAANVPVEYVFYPNENHGWAGANLVDSFNRIVSFLQLHVN